MSSRRGDNRGGGGGGPRDSDRPDVRDRGAQDTDDTNIDTRVPPSRALVVQRRGQLLVAESGLPRVAARLPVGLATAEQVDNFREVRTRLLAMAATLGLRYFTTLVVPMTSGSGASFVARNLAAAFTLQDNQMAMLVDCNMRHPTQHQALGARSDDGGLFDFLDQPHAAIDQLVRPTAIPGLHLIPAGQPPARPREYFSSAAMRMLMSALREEQCYVFLDGPPTRGSPDARILADLADFVVLVLGYGCATTDEISQTVAMFDPSKFAGVVFNERA
ncbi:MAG: CpsD/CapB family tyrosine-protein kinase [Polyangia bacterium]